MKTFVRSLCLAIVMLSALTALAQNPNYSSYYSYTITYNDDGSATVTATAEVFGWDDADDWVIGGYRPLCSLHPKAQVTPDADWVSTVGRGLYQTIDFVHTGAPIQLPADGTEVAIDFAVEVDVSCNRPSYYYLYPPLVSLSSWSPIRMEWFFLQGFSPFQTNPPSWVTYCFSPEVCPVGNGQAYFYNFADFADFFASAISVTTWPYQVEWINVNSEGAVAAEECPTQPYPGYVKYVTNQVQRRNGSAYAVPGLSAADQITVGGTNDLGITNAKVGSLPTTGDGSFQDQYSVCSPACPASSGESDALQNWTVSGIPLPHVNGVVYRCTSILIDGR